MYHIISSCRYPVTGFQMPTAEADFDVDGHICMFTSQKDLEGVCLQAAEIRIFDEPFRQIAECTRKDPLTWLQRPPTSNDHFFLHGEFHTETALRIATTTETALQIATTTQTALRRETTTETALRIATTCVARPATGFSCAIGRFFLRRARVPCDEPHPPFFTGSSTTEV